ncbi:ATP phosphoribosyltransferase [Enterococcus saccharolyticus]|uniref:ATP phosphoribosyltransferase n=1 Tax=Candidatus Enterococcus willemsii TaxID=1857215 RepID=A0ABQ6Z201_9ENTE|nr:MULTISPECIES: ATP phosphoribosyltransferase [Enterococcus]KAF1305548.1 ATP phosphoribosyltransferase [Enterococcus sp. CU12B]MCD5002694.1 ATP phosphoribosyltransferase [Enterococcus saccharolyticus]
MENLFSVLRPEEQIALHLRGLYQRHGFHLYHLSSFEEYELYSQNKSFLNEAEVITFTGGDGRIMALKPDITLSIVKNTPSNETRKVYYYEDVYRHDRQNGEYLRIHQTGLEYIGDIQQAEELEVLHLALESLSLAGGGVLDLSHMGVLHAICQLFPIEQHSQVMKALQQKSHHVIRELAELADVSEEKIRVLEELITLSGDFNQAYEKMVTLLQNPTAVQALKKLKQLYDALQTENKLPNNVKVRIDFSIVNDADYYSGLLFQGFVQNEKQAVLFGGRYDRLLRKQDKTQGGIGFGMYLNNLGRTADEETIVNDYLCFALPKGRMAENVYRLLVNAGLASDDIFEDNRKLIFVDEEKKLKFFLVKPSDVAIYVEHGVADVGVIGKDVLDETEPNVLELLDLKMGKCKMAVAAHKDFVQDTTRTLKVATKYTNTTRKYFGRLGQSVELIQLHGSIELAPLLHLSDVIVDIVETGTTLRENDLTVIQDIADSSARLVVNHSTWRFKESLIQTLLEKVKEQL